MEAIGTILTVFGMTRSGIEPTTYQCQDGHWWVGRGTTWPSELDHLTIGFHCVQQLVDILPLPKCSVSPKRTEMSPVDERPRSMAAKRAANIRRPVERDGWDGSTSRQSIYFGCIGPRRMTFITKKVRDPLLSLCSLCGRRRFQFIHVQDSGWNSSHWKRQRPSSSVWVTRWECWTSWTLNKQGLGRTSQNMFDKIWNKLHVYRPSIFYSSGPPQWALGCRLAKRWGTKSLLSPRTLKGWSLGKNFLASDRTSNCSQNKTLWKSHSINSLVCCREKITSICCAYKNRCICQYLDPCIPLKISRF